jgi:alpha-amylase
VLVGFLDNHDLPRFLFEQPDDRALWIALFYLFTWDGLPCVYYGTEQLFAGGVDPKNREDLGAGNPARGFAPYATDHDAFQRLQALIRLRKDNAALRRGSVEIRFSSETEAGVFAFERVAPEQTALVVLNTADDVRQTCADTTCASTSFPRGTVLRDIAPGSDGQTFTVAGDGTIAVSVPARTGRVLIP